MRQSRTRLLYMVTLLACAPVPYGTAQGTAPGLWTVDDPAGDLQLNLGPSGAAAPIPSSNDVLNALDAVRVSIVDLDEADLRVQWKTVAGFRPTNAGAYPVYGMGIAHILRFQVPSQDDPTFGLVAILSEQQQTPQGNLRYAAVRAMFCLVTDPVFTCHLNQATEVPLGFAGDEAFAEIPKRMLVRGSDAPGESGGLPAALHPGSRLTNIVAQSYMLRALTFNGDSLGELADSIPNQGTLAPFELVYGSIDEKIRMDLTSGSIIGGEWNHLRVQVTNPGLGEVDVSLRPDVESSSEWTSQATRSLHLRPGATANATLSILPPATRGETAQVRLRAWETARAGTVVGLARGSFVSVDPLDESTATWWVHATPVEPGPGGWSGYRPGRTGFLQRVDPGDSSARIDLVGRGNANGAEFTTLLADQEGLPNRAAVGQDPAIAQLSLESTAAMSAQLVLSLQDERGEIAAGMSAIELAAGASEHEVPLPWVASNANLAPSYGSLRLLAKVARMGVDGMPLAFNEILLVPGASWLSIPLERDYGSDVAVGLSGLALAAADDSHATLNPGRSKVLDVDVRNQGDAPLRFRFGIEPLMGAWPARVVPDETVELVPDAELRIAVVAEAPPDANEGERFQFRLVAFEASTGDPLAGLSFSMVATSGVDVPDERLEGLGVEAGAKTSGPHVAGLLAALGMSVAFTVWRRRRNRSGPQE